MRKTFLLLLTLASCFALWGCYQALATFKSAYMIRFQSGAIPVATQELTAEQIGKLAAWLQDHPWGWQPITETYTPETVVWVTHFDDTQSPIRLARKKLVVNQSQRSLSEAESQELHAILLSLIHI